MHLSSILLTGSLALAANAVLVPLDATSPHQGNVGLATSKQTVNLNCEGCFAALEANTLDNIDYVKASAEKGLKMEIPLHFSLENQELRLDGTPFYPPERAMSPPVFFAQQKVQGLVGTKAYQGRLPLSVAIDVQSPVQVRVNEGNVKVHHIAVEVLGLGKHPAYVPKVQIGLAELSNGQFVLLPIETTPYKPNPAEKSCSSIVCRARAVIASKLAAFRAAAAAKYGAFRAFGAGCIRKLAPGRAKHHPHVSGGTTKFTGHNQSGSHAPRFHSAFGRFVHNILLPILFGVFTGMFLGAVTMLVFSVTRLLAARLRGRCGSAAYSPVGQEVEEGRASVDGPPKYEDVYVEPQEDVTDEKQELLRT